MPDRVIETDVLVLGGGLAGCIAAIRAREQGAKVLVVDKAAIRRSGEAGRGNYFYTSYLNSGEPWDTPEVYRQWYQDVRQGLVDMKVVDALVVPHQVPVINYVEKLGVSLKDPRTGKYVRKARGWTDQVHTIVFRGENMKLTLGQRVKETGADVMEGVHLTNLLTLKGRAVGATGFHVRSGDFYTFKAKAVVLGLGNPQRILDTPDHNPFNTYHKPWHAGTGYALAYRAGVELSNLEFIYANLFPRFCTAAGVLREAGGKLINGLGEPIVQRPDRPGERSFGFAVTASAYREINAGRGPIYLDCRHVSEQELKNLEDNVMLDAPLLKEYLEQSGIDLRKDLVEFLPLLGEWSATGSPKGILIDEKCHSCVPGLFVVGDLATPSDACSGAFTTGYVAGVEAAKYAGRIPSCEVDEAEAREEKARVFAPLGRSTGIGWQEFETTVRRAMIEYVSQVRTDLGLKTAMSAFKTAEKYVPHLKAANYHELMRAMEAVDILHFDQLMTAAALERTETRFAFLIGHYRADYPQRDEENWKEVATIVKRDGDRIAVSRRRMNL
ncbi:MAG: FAD-binding protein [Chloroflexi bacterium]|nr:FAD-binding protein [Chloroflexota bacterium]